MDLGAVEGLDAQHRGVWERFDIDRVVRVTACAGGADDATGARVHDHR
jgi:hypothetical protein